MIERHALAHVVLRTWSQGKKGKKAKDDGEEGGAMSDAVRACVGAR